MVGDTALSSWVSGERDIRKRASHPILIEMRSLSASSLTSLWVERVSPGEYVLQIAASGSTVGNF